MLNLLREGVRVVERHSRFLVVEKLGEAAEIAIEHVPRS
jgi:hypothetical protein